MTKIKVHIVIGISTLQYYAGKIRVQLIAHVKKNQIFFYNLRRIFSLWRGKIIRGLALRSRTLISISRNKSAQNASSTFGSFK